MDKTLLREIIKDFEVVSRVVNSRLDQLRSMLGETSYNQAPENIRNNIKETIAQQRNDMMKKIEDMRKQAMTQVQESIGNHTSVPGFGMTGMNQGHSSVKEIEQMRQQILEKIENKKNNVIDIKESDFNGD